MFIIEKQGLEKQELLAQITAYHAAKVLDIQTQNVSLEFTELQGDLYGSVLSPDGLHLITINANNGVTKIIETVCHELRHVWQAKHGWEFDYSLPYREQPHEIDAWNFMYQFVDEYKDIIYEEYLSRKDSIIEEADDWENYLIPPPEYDVEPDLSEMMGLSYKQNTNKKESIKMTKQFTVKQLNKAGLVASDDMHQLIADKNITTVAGLKTLRSELEQDNRGTVRISFKSIETYAALLPCRLVKGEVEGITLASNAEWFLRAELEKFQTAQLKANKALLNVDGYVVYLSETQMNAFLKTAAKLAGRYETNVKAIYSYVDKLGFVGAQLEMIVNQVVVGNPQKLREFPLTNAFTDSIKPLVDDAISYLSDIAHKSCVLDEAVIESIETVVEETPAADESPVAEETNTEKEDDKMTETKFLIKDGMISVDDHNALVVEIQQGLVTDFQREFTKMQDLYEATISKLQDVIASQEKEIETVTQVAIDSELKASAESDVAKELKELRAELDTVKNELNKANSLRKSDAKRIEKLQNEMGRARLKLREHDVRGVSADKVYELPEQEVTATVKARIKTTAAIGNAAMSIHDNAPEKIENAAEATKDGVQWIADKTKDGIDLTAKGANVVAEKTANAMIYVAEKIAPSKEQVVESIFKVQGDVKTVELNGVVYKYGADGKLIF